MSSTTNKISIVLRASTKQWYKVTQHVHCTALNARCGDGIFALHWMRDVGMGYIIEWFFIRYLFIVRVEQNNCFAFRSWVWIDSWSVPRRLASSYLLKNAYKKNNNNNNIKATPTGRYWNIIVGSAALVPNFPHLSQELFSWLHPIWGEEGNTANIVLLIMVIISKRPDQYMSDG